MINFALNCLGARNTQHQQEVKTARTIFRDLQCYISKRACFSALLKDQAEKEGLFEGTHTQSDDCTHTQTYKCTQATLFLYPSSSHLVYLLHAAQSQEH